MAKVVLIAALLKTIISGKIKTKKYKIF